MKFLLCVDGSENSIRASEFIAELISPPNQELTVLFVVQDREVMSLSERGRDWREEVRERVEKCFDVLQSEQVEFTESIQIGKPSEVILDMATEYDAVVMGYKGRGALADVVIGSVSKKTLKNSKRPVILVP